MSRLCVVPIVEGHGEVEAVRTLLDRVWREVVGGEYIEVLRPVRQPRTKLLKRSTGTGGSKPRAVEIERAIKLAAIKLDDRSQSDVPGLILLMLDLDSDCLKTLVPELTNAVRDAAGPTDFAIVLANIEYETWFVAAAISLRDFILLQPGDADIKNPETDRLGKKWIQDRFAFGGYSETVDQVKLTYHMDLQLCRERSSSFDKLCRELEKRLITDQKS